MLVPSCHPHQHQAHHVGIPWTCTGWLHRSCMRLLIGCVWCTTGITITFEEIIWLSGHHETLNQEPHHPRLCGMRREIDLHYQSATCLHKTWDTKQRRAFLQNSSPGSCLQQNSDPFLCTSSPCTVLPLPTTNNYMSGQSFCNWREEVASVKG
jgi:hypothetical protein